jgi:uncharacterized protein YqfA (UPF0365 family)
VQTVVNALISAQKAGIPLNFDRAAAIDLAGRDVFLAVQDERQPEGHRPPPSVSAVAKDGIQLIAISRVTLRANIDKPRRRRRRRDHPRPRRRRHRHHHRLGEPQTPCSKTPTGSRAPCSRRASMPGTAFEILSIDIADIDVGNNIGAKLQMDQAEADKNIAQARKPRGRRAMAIAEEQEMRARVQEMRAPRSWRRRPRCRWPSPPH